MDFDQGCPQGELWGFFLLHIYINFFFIKDFGQGDQSL